ncbi:hypothetical protein H2199_000433 [Coniosporium tulheliwenetii]|uniref:Uncharacterized protein n=1 Tax=Coniosporium tulheliwenetii TaxID=3383036 RepID=A0ACC2ZQ66_9PEZI|nr:hypothetical protein H2199_000433 [Cladosporium sp. JES 115]
MTTKDSSLYGIPRPKKASGKEISSSTTLAFTSQLSTLIASSTSTTNRSSTGRARPKKDDIFATHNKGSRKRALKDLDDVCFEQKHSTSSDALDAATYHRSKRKMEEKARLYAAMKRGDVEDVDEKYAVDFDRNEAENEVVEYTDEFGRTRRGTKAEAAREERRKKAAAADEPDRFTARSAAPSNIIYGDTVQAAAFNPDVTIAEQMAALAAKRDKEVTPPPDEHFDGSKEIRTKGTGFYQFSADKEMRAREMEALEKERAETERAREERDRRKEERKREVEEKRKAIKEKRGKVQADRFLDSLGDALG